MKKNFSIKVKGLVQGVGFRPFVYRLALKFNLTGWVKNSSSGVEIVIEGENSLIKKFIKNLTEHSPVNSQIEKIEITKEDIKNYNKFEILASDEIKDQITYISPDITICSDCLNDMKSQKNRINYPFINCTNCGPRFTIIKDIPYDREKTSMNKFTMCEVCQKEYNDITDRRFHAEPIACNICGPHYTLKLKNEEINQIERIIDTLVKIIEEGGVVAVKSLGGFNFICDAFSEEAVKKLREIKKRDNKPFALMFKDLKFAKKYAHISRQEKELLESWQKPVVILRQKKQCAYSVNTGLTTIGVILPYMGIHYMLFEKLKTPAVVFTSGNFSETPIIIGNETALNQLTDICDGVLIYNRDIINRVDDSVAAIINKKTRIIRRSRSYAPLPIKVNFDVGGILSCGGELKNTICIGRNNLAFISQYIGDLKNPETFSFFTETIERYKNLAKVEPSLIACDLHPDYLSTGYALRSGLNVVKIQHHHAHIASCMAENNLDEKVIGVSFDGTGYGDDGSVWGGEFLICDLTDYKRVYHLDNVILPGGDTVIREPWRMTLSYLYSIYGEKLFNLKIPFIEKIDKQKARFLITAIKNNINCFYTSSAGRLFDAVSALLNITHYSSFEAEAAIRLECHIRRGIKAYYSFNINDGDAINNIFRQIIFDINKEKGTDIISAKFHNTIVLLINEICNKIRLQCNTNKAVLSGGVFQNRYLLTNTENTLKRNGFLVYSNKVVPANDGGLSLGQLAIAAKRREKNVFKHTG
jgi:hydrogenase maturation protein HypF